MPTLRLCFFFLVVINLITSCQNTPSSVEPNSERPMDPWVFRSVLDDNSRMISLALDDDLWISYYTETGSPYKAWKGGINFEGAVYTMVHGPQPTTFGKAYFIGKNKPVWSIKKGQLKINSEFHYLGHKLDNGRVSLMYKLSSDQGDIFINEQVEVEKSESGSVILQRDFTTKQEDDNIQAYLDFNTNSVAFIESIKTNESFELKSKEAVKKDNKELFAVTGGITLKANEKTPLHIQFVSPSLPDQNSIDADIDADIEVPLGARLIARNDCKTCHNKNVKTVGPAYVSVAKKYEDTQDNINMLINKVRVGGTGVWGQEIMNGHAELSFGDIEEMVKYILSLDNPENVSSNEKRKSVHTIERDTLNTENVLPGAIVAIYHIPQSTKVIPKDFSKLELFQGGIYPNFDNVGVEKFKGLDDIFAMEANGYLHIEKEGIYDIRLWSDDGSKLYFNDKLYLDNDGRHSIEVAEGKFSFKSGYYPFRIEYFDTGGGKFISFNIKGPNDSAWKVIPANMIVHNIEDRTKVIGKTLPMADDSSVPGDAIKLTSVHPSFDLHQARPAAFAPKVGGMDFFSDGRLAISTWDAEGAVYVLSNLKAEDPEDIQVKKIASGLSEPLGLKIVNDEIYIIQKQEMTHLVDTDGDELIDEYRTLCDDWEVTTNFHEFSFGLEEKDGYLYANLSTGIQPGGASAVDQPLVRGSVVKVSIETGKYEVVANGLRTPNGIGKGYKNELFVADNQGDWLPSSKIVHVQKDAFYGSRSILHPNVDKLEETKPVVWLPQNEIGNSPSTPSYINVGPYKGQMIHSEVTHGGVKRVFVEEVNGKLQGCLFRFAQGLEAGINRLTWANDEDLYLGGIGNNGNWQDNSKLWYGLQRMSYNGRSTFEMLAIRAKTNGLEIEFTEPLKVNDGWEKENYQLQQWYYLPTKEYGGPKLGLENLNITSVNISKDRKKVFLEINGLKKDHVVYLHLDKLFVSEKDHELWTTEAWYTMNEIPNNQPGFMSRMASPKQLNTLTNEEKSEGWELLFDGKSFEGWHNFNKKTVGKSWIIKDHAMHLDASSIDKNGNHYAVEGGDIVTNGAYENFEFSCEWKISNCGNSGIFYNVVEDEKFHSVWQTGPEMQVLDNVCHPDTKYPTHRAGDLYDMIETKYPSFKGAGNWNEARIISIDGKVEFWLNGVNVVRFEMFNDQWTSMIANSKFKDMPDFGLAKSGHLALQDHSDKVWYRNVKIRKR